MTRKNSKVLIKKLSQNITFMVKNSILNLKRPRIELKIVKVKLSGRLLSEMKPLIEKKLSLHTL